MPMNAISEALLLTLAGLTAAGALAALFAFIPLGRRRKARARETDRLFNDYLKTVKKA